MQQEADGIGAMISEEEAQELALERLANSRACHICGVWTDATAYDCLLCAQLICPPCRRDILLLTGSPREIVVAIKRILHVMEQANKDGGLT